MSILVPITLFGWIPLVLLMFSMMPSLKAVCWAYVLGWLFLPMAGYSIMGLPDYTKFTATIYAIFLGTIIFAPDRFRGLKFNWLDLVVLVGCIAQGFSSYFNNLGMRDAFSVIFKNMISEAGPYFLGRMYIRSLDDLRIVGKIILLATLIYLPLVLYEIKMSPQLHRIFYGFFQHSFTQTKRGGGWRPMVFMPHGLVLSMWMAIASLIAFWFWKCRTQLGKLGPSMGLVVFSLIVMTILCRSTGATALMLLGIAILWSLQYFKKQWLLIALVSFPIAWTVLRTAGIWSGDLLLNLAGQISSERRGSLFTRIQSENSFSAKAMRKPVFGWGGQGDYIPYDDEKLGQKAIPDGYWIIVLGKYGWVGLGCWLTIGSAPAWLLIRNWPVKYWSHPAFAIMTVLTVVITLYLIDGIFNAMRVTFWTFVIGGMRTVFMEIGRPAQRVEMDPRNGMKQAR